MNNFVPVICKINFQVICSLLLQVVSTCLIHGYYIGSLRHKERAVLNCRSALCKLCEKRPCIHLGWAATKDPAIVNGKVDSLMLTTFMRISLPSLPLWELPPTHMCRTP
jgi:hypothetical protein